MSKNSNAIKYVLEKTNPDIDDKTIESAVDIFSKEKKLFKIDELVGKLNIITIKHMKSLPFKYKKVMNNLLLERVDYFDTAQQLVKQYGLKSRVKFTSGSQMAEYVPETDTITLRRSYPSLKEFLLTVLHEIKHALDAKRLGVRKFIKKYTQAGTMAQYRGLDPHDDNRWEEKA